MNLYRGLKSSHAEGRKTKYSHCQKKGNVSPVSNNSYATILHSPREMQRLESEWLAEKILLTH